MPDVRGNWSSRIGFVMAASGSAVGLANVWAFPFRTGQNGGAAFVIIYLLCTFTICMPFMFGEITLGRFSQKNAVGAIRAVSNSRAWMGLGVLCLGAGFFILSFYSVVAGWTVGYVFKMLIGDQTPFPNFASSTVLVVPLLAIFLVLTVAVVYRGVQHGLERWTKLLMPVLLVLILVLVVHGLTLPGAARGIEFFLKPDFSKITGKTVVIAMGQAFFSLSLGIGGLLTYGSYLSKNENIVNAAVQVVALDTVIALLAGLMIFPALFSFGQQPAEGPALVFVILPEIFAQMPIGNVLGAVFFLMLTIAGLTSTISMLEIPVAYFVDERGWQRKKIAWLLGAFVFVAGLPSALSQGAVPGLSSLSFFGGKSFLEMMIFLWFDIFPPLGALLFSILIGWVWGADKAADEMSLGNPKFKQPFIGSLSQASIWGFFIRYVCPAAILVIWANAVFD